MKYFIFNKMSDYERGYQEHVEWDGAGFCTAPGYCGRAVFFSRILDSAEEGTIWHRICCEGPEQSSAVIQISLYTSDELPPGSGDGGEGLRRVIRSGELSLQEKKDRLSPFLRKKQPFSPDLLLHGLIGRYLWFLLEIYPQGKEGVRLKNITIYFPAKSWLDYLPEVYRREMGNDSFLDRYLSVFQSLYDDVGRKIRDFPSRLEPGLADAKSLGFLASWLDIESPYMWEEEKLRRLLENAVEFYGARGTRRGLELFVEFYTGERPFVVEWQDWENLRGISGQGRLLTGLYADDPGSVTVLVREACIADYRAHQALLRLMEQIKPAQIELHLVALKPYIFIGQYSYLGVNSVLGKYEEAVLGGNGRISFTAMAEQEKRSGQ